MQARADRSAADRKAIRDKTRKEKPSGASAERAKGPSRRTLKARQKGAARREREARRANTEEDSPAEDSLEEEEGDMPVERSFNGSSPGRSASYSRRATTAPSSSSRARQETEQPEPEPAETGGAAAGETEIPASPDYDEPDIIDTTQSAQEASQADQEDDDAADDIIGSPESTPPADEARTARNATTPQGDSERTEDIDPSNSGHGQDPNGLASTHVSAGTTRRDLRNTFSSSPLTSPPPPSEPNAATPVTKPSQTRKSRALRSKKRPTAFSRTSTPSIADPSLATPTATAMTESQAAVAVREEMIKRKVHGDAHLLNFAGAGKTDASR